jgi:hypothetical protein
MSLQLFEEDIDDLLYLARTGELEDLNACINTISARENSTVSTLLLAAKDASSGNGPLHMAAANGHTGKCTSQPCEIFLTLFIALQKFSYR